MTRRVLIAAAAVAALAVAALPAAADVKPNPLFSDGMVLQREREVPIWGTADEGEKVTVRFRDQEASTTTREGKWQVRVKSLAAGGPSTLTIAGQNTVEIKDVLVGEVWVCSGQSNMAFPLQRAAGADQEIPRSGNPKIRLLKVPTRATDAPLAEVDVRWTECGPETAASFTAVGYYFGRDLQKALGIPVGLIHTAVGGTPAEAWTSRAALEANPALGDILETYAAAVEKWPQAKERHDAAVARWRERARQARQEGKTVPRQPQPPLGPESNKRPAGLYNGMIAPLIPYAIRGALWYQGEANASRAAQYRTLFPATIEDWRDAWGQGEFPFFFVQLAPYGRAPGGPEGMAWAELRDAQRFTWRTVPNTAMAVITDLGDETDIHPTRKEPVGGRLALAARALVYGEKVVWSGPVCDRMSIEGNQVWLHFEHVGGGLVAKDGPLKGFAVAGADGRFVPAQAEIRREQVRVYSPDVDAPTAMRYGWCNYPDVNLFNREGLPALPFQVDGKAAP